MLIFYAKCKLLVRILVSLFSVKILLLIELTYVNQVLTLVLLDLPGLLFFSTYTLLVLFWAEIYHQVIKHSFVRVMLDLLPVRNIYNSVLANFKLWEFDLWASIAEQARSLPSDKLKISYISINGAMYFIQVYLSQNDLLLLIKYLISFLNIW